MRISEVLLSGGEGKPRWIKTSFPLLVKAIIKFSLTTLSSRHRPTYFSSSYQEIYLDRGRVISLARNWINRYVVEDLFCLQFFFVNLALKILQYKPTHG